MGCLDKPSKHLDLVVIVRVQVPDRRKLIVGGKLIAGQATGEKQAAVVKLMAIELLMAAGAEVSYHDPHVPTFPPMRKHDIDLASIPLTEETLREHDAVLIVTNHRAIDYDLIGRAASLVVDTRNAMDSVKTPAAVIVKA